jgi:hypothetical protein
MTQSRSMLSSASHHLRHLSPLRHTFNSLICVAASTKASAEPQLQGIQYPKNNKTMRRGYLSTYWAHISLNLLGT